MSEELKPCPFCGSIGKIIKFTRCDRKYVVICQNEECMASVANSEDAEEPWKPSIHMPKEAARIWLKVTDVRVERLQDITIDGIRNEGLSSASVHAGDIEIALKEWELLWDSTIKKSDLDRHGWDANPWVWIIGFERCEKPAESPYAWNDAIHKLTKGV